MKLTPEEERLILERRKNEAQKKFQPRSLDSYTPAEKVVWFNKMYDYAMQQLHQKQDGDFDEDSRHYTWETVMELLAPKGDRRIFWNYWGSLSGY